MNGEDGIMKASTPRAGPDFTKHHHGGKRRLCCDKVLITFQMFDKYKKQFDIKEDILNGDFSSIVLNYTHVYVYINVVLVNMGLNFHSSNVCHRLP